MIDIYTVHTDTDKHTLQFYSHTNTHSHCHCQILTAHAMIANLRKYYSILILLFFRSILLYKIFIITICIIYGCIVMTVMMKMNISLYICVSYFLHDALACVFVYTYVWCVCVCKILAICYMCSRFFRNGCF